MNPFLTGLLGAVVGALVLGALGWWWFRRKLRRLAEGLGELVTGLSAAVPPFRISLRRAAEQEWNDGDAVKRASAELERNGYVREGDFIVPELNDMPLRGFVHPEGGIAHALYENPVNDLLVADAVTFLPDDSSLTVTNAPNTGLERPPFTRQIRIEANLNGNPIGIMELHDALVRAREGQRAGEVEPGRFADLFVAEWSRVMDWHVGRGGVTPGEVREIARLAEQPRPDDAAVEKVRAQWTAAICEFVEERIRDRFLRTGAMSAADWEDKRERVQFIHERMDVPSLIETLAWDMVENDSHIEADDDDEGTDEDARAEAATAKLRRAFSGADVREGFRRALPLMPENLQWQYFCKVAGDYPADVYLTPQLAYEYDELET